MKSFKILFSVLMLFTGFAVSSCDRTKPGTVDTKEDQHSKDVDRVKSESDQVVSDAESIMSETSLGRLAGGSGTAGTVCGASIDTSAIAQKTITVTYDGVTTCNGYLRSGSITLHLTQGNHWRDAGAVMEITHTNYKVIRQSDNKSITFNGVKYVTNVNGFSWATLSRQYKERATNLVLTFDDGSERQWSLARNWNITITSLSPIGISYVISGDSTLNGTANVMAWGSNRYGTTFTNHTPTAITTTYGLNGCGFTKPLSGKIVHDLSGKGTLSATFGVDASGNAVTSGCAYGYKLEWEGINGNTASAVKPYN